MGCEVLGLEVETQFCHLFVTLIRGLEQLSFWESWFHRLETEMLHPCPSTCQSTLRAVARKTECKKGLPGGETVWAEFCCSNNTALTCPVLKRSFFLMLTICYRPG